MVCLNEVGQYVRVRDSRQGKKEGSLSEGRTFIDVSRMLPSHR